MQNEFLGVNHKVEATWDKQGSDYHNSVSSSAPKIDLKGLAF